MVVSVILPSDQEFRRGNAYGDSNVSQVTEDGKRKSVSERPQRIDDSYSGVKDEWKCLHLQKG